MAKALVLASSAFVVVHSAADPPTSLDPYPSISLTERAITIGLEDFARLPDSDQGVGELVAARMMLMTHEPGTERLFVNDLNGPMYCVGYEGDVTPYLHLDAPRWQLALDKAGRAKGFQSFAFHPQFNQPRTPGYGRFYTLVETRATGRGLDPPVESG